jgi:hypothetical protein
MMEAVRTSETSVDNHFTRQYNPEDSSEQGLMSLHWMGYALGKTSIAVYQWTAKQFWVDRQSFK